MESHQTHPLLTILHFNDVYDIQKNKKGYGGIVNFEAYIRTFKSKYPKTMVLFSGDAFSPSALTNIYEGQQMVKSLNRLGINAACYGNHQFDLEPKVTDKLSKQCNFPWLLGNIRYRDSDFLLGDGQKFIVKELENGERIGLFGIAGEDWLGILGDEYDEDLEYIHYGQHSKQMCKILKQEHKCSMIIALTHMRVPLDEALPFQAPEIDLILGGHDHIIMEKFINNILVVKSGDNFKHIRTINIYKKGAKESPQYLGNSFDFDTQIIKVPEAEQPDLELQQYVEECMSQYLKHDRIVGWTDVELETRFSKIRTQQTNYGNFCADLVRLFYDIEICLLNSGGTRIDGLIHPGPLKYSTISNIINDILVVKNVPGKVLLQALEYACSSCPNVYAGSFLQVSGLQYSYDYRKNPRVQEVLVGQKPLQLEKNYTVGMHSYMANGGDGYSMFGQCSFQKDPAASIDHLSLLLKFFKSPECMNLSIMGPSEIVHLREQTGKFISIQEQELPQLPSLTKKPSVKISRISKLRNRVVILDNNKKFASIAPKKEKRIISLYP